MALNYGIKKASGNIIITIDADCILLPETIENFVKPFIDKSISAVVGNVKIGNTETVVGVVQFLEFLSSFYTKNAESVLGTIYIMGGAAAAFRREVFERVGLYSEVNITEDIDLSVRVRDAGMKVVYEDRAIVYTEGASDIISLQKQRLRWKIGWFQTINSNKHLIFSRNNKHNKVLSWFIIPYVYFSNVQLFFEVWFVLLLYIYSYLIRDFTPFITWIIAEAIMMCTILIVEIKNIKTKNVFLLTPITWLLFYLATYVEYYALVSTIINIIRKKEVRWQKWSRKGCNISGN